MIGGCAPRTPLSWSHSTRSWMPAEYSHALALEERSGFWFALLFMNHSALLQLVRHPARDHIDAHPVQRVWLSDVWAGPSAQHTWGDALVCRGVVQSIRSDQDRFAVRPSLYNRHPSTRWCQGITNCCGRRQTGVPGRHSSVWAGSVRLCQPDTPTPISCRGIHMGHVWVHPSQRGE